LRSTNRRQASAFSNGPGRQEAAGWRFHVLTQIKAQALIEAFHRLP